MKLNTKMVWEDNSKWKIFPNQYDAIQRILGFVPGTRKMAQFSVVDEYIKDGKRRVVLEIE